MISVCPHLSARVLMTRDMDLIRKIVLEIEARKGVEPRPLTIEGVDPIVLLRHLEMMHKAGLLEAQVFYSDSADNLPDIMDVTDLSWEGHDFAAVVKNENIWGKMKAVFPAAELAGMPLSVIKDVGIALLKDWAKTRLGIGSL
jgi:hypothetical protein